MTEMYLSKITLDTTKRNTMLALRSPGKFHGALESSFAGPRQRNLWRLDKLGGDLCILLLSESVPDLSGFCDQFCQSHEAAQTKAYDGLLARTESGTKWRFRLTANPVKSQKKTGERGKVLAHITAAYQKQWLLEHCVQHGFRLAADSFDVTQSKWYQFYKGDNNRVSLLAVTYEGVLEVSDEDLFRQTLVSGIGRGKAYGMGLLTVMRLQEK